MCGCVLQKILTSVLDLKIHISNNILVVKFNQPTVDIQLDKILVVKLPKKIPPVCNNNKSHVG